MIPPMPMISVQDAAQKYGDHSAAAGNDWIAGAQRTDKDPTALAAAAGQKAVSAYTQAWTSQRIPRALVAVGKQGWLAGFNTDSASRYASAAQTKGRTKWAAKMNVWFPIFDQLAGQIAQMPKNTPQDSINRVAYWINGTISAKQNL